MATFILKEKKEDKMDITRYIARHPRLKDYDSADYCLVVDTNHHIYKYQTSSNVWYVHVDPNIKTIFKICVYINK